MLPHKSRCGPAIFEDLAVVYSKYWPEAYGGEGKDLPAAWCGAQVIGLYKGKGDRLDPGNSRSIFLLDIAGKILARICALRIQPLYELALDDSQCGFRYARSTAQARLSGAITEAYRSV